MVGADDTMTPVLWTRYFLEEQGFTVDNNIMFKDNMSTMLLEKMENGPAQKGQNILAYNIFILLNESKKDISAWYIVQPMKW